ncbi:MAG: hypothetical protein NUW01_04730 [Gemmatimonadaceae bacterium]|nr:hypothetical protein [Gemmatimonadaceae bacterium]
MNEAALVGALERAYVERFGEADLSVGITATYDAGFQDGWTAATAVAEESMSILRGWLEADAKAFRQYAESLKGRAHGIDLGLKEERFQ